MFRNVSQLLKIFLPLFCLCIGLTGLAHADNHWTLTVNNQTNQSLTWRSMTSTAVVKGPNTIDAQHMNNLSITFSPAGGTLRAVIVFNDPHDRPVRKLLIIVNGKANISRAMCVPFSSCKKAPQMNITEKSIDFFIQN